MEKLAAQQMTADQFNDDLLSWEESLLILTALSTLAATILLSLQ
jgi:hypothetical protein